MMFGESIMSASHGPSSAVTKWGVDIPLLRLLVAIYIRLSRYTLWANAGKNLAGRKLGNSGQQPVLDWNPYEVYKKNPLGSQHSYPVCGGIEGKPTLTARNVDGCLLWEYRRSNKKTGQSNTEPF
jgi:hypothetical protein